MYWKIPKLKIGQNILPQTDVHCWKITPNVSLEVFNSGVFRHFLSYGNWPVWQHSLTASQLTIFLHF